MDISQVDDEVNHYMAPQLVRGEVYINPQTKTPLRLASGALVRPGNFQAWITEWQNADPSRAGQQPVRGTDYDVQQPQSMGVSAIDGVEGAQAAQLPAYLRTLPLTPLFREDVNADQLRYYLALTPLQSIPPWMQLVPGVKQFLTALQNGNTLGLSATPTDYGLSPQQMVQQAQGRGDNLVVDEKAVVSLQQQVDMTYMPEVWKKQNLWKMEHVAPYNDRQLELAAAAIRDRRIAMTRERELLQQEMKLSELTRELAASREMSRFIDARLGREFDQPWKGAYYQQHVNDYALAYPNKSRGEAERPMTQWPAFQPGAYPDLPQADSEPERRRITTHPAVSKSEEDKIAQWLFKS